MTEDEVVRAGVTRLKQLAHLRIPEYELPADSFLEAAVCDILRLEFFKLKQENQELMDVNIYEHSVAETAKQELVKLMASYEDAIDQIGDWGAYASVYFQEKHDLAGCIFRHKSILKRAGVITNSAQTSSKLVDPPSLDELRKEVAFLHYTGRHESADLLQRCILALGYVIPPKEDT